MTPTSAEKARMIRSVELSLTDMGPGLSVGVNGIDGETARRDTPAAGARPQPVPRDAPRGVPSESLPPWRSVLAVVAHPDDESFGLGAVIDSFIRAGADVSVLCLTHGEASTLHGVAGELKLIREAELRAAGVALGISAVQLEAYPDGGLAAVPLTTLAAEVSRTAASVAADGIIAFDSSGVTGHTDHIAATAAAVQVGADEGLEVLGWTLPAEVATTLRAEFGAPFLGHSCDEIDFTIVVQRSSQMAAVACHPSQALPASVLWRRLDLLGEREHLRWLHTV